MNIKDQEPVSFANIVKALSDLEAQALKMRPKDVFERLAMNTSVFAKFQSKIFHSNQVGQDISDLDLLCLKRGTIYDWSSIKSNLEFFIWSRKSSIVDLTRQALASFKGNSLLLTCMALRAILESVGNACLLRRDLKQFPEPDIDLHKRMEWLNGIDDLIDVRLKGMRIDYSTILKKGLRLSKQYSYKPGVDEADWKANDLLTGVDVLTKTVKGARATYEFFSEFAHPNMASVYTNYDQTIMKVQFGSINCYSALHNQTKIGDIFIEDFGSILFEGIDIISESIKELQLADDYFHKKADEVATIAQKCIRDMVKKNPQLFDKRENCPCNSGKNIQYCCGRLINASKFSNWTKFPSLH
jgi:hypothetical protein